MSFGSLQSGVRSTLMTQAPKMNGAPGRQVWCITSPARHSAAASANDPASVSGPLGLQSAQRMVARCAAVLLRGEGSV